LANRTLLLGTTNTHKVEELVVLLRGLPWTVKSLRDFDPVPAPDETGGTFEANALLKAHYYARQFEVVCVADDSGLCVDALDGGPGVYSARFAGPDAKDADNNRKLLRLLEPVTWSERTARFVCCAAMAGPGMESVVFKGVVEGHISVEAHGTQGFGYDPLFVPEGEEHTFAELGPKVKNKMSHRARAFAKLRAYLEDFQ
jgi:XTP/dITP diphosphohydrolase